MIDAKNYEIYNMWVSLPLLKFRRYNYTIYYIIIISTNIFFFYVALFKEKSGVLNTNEKQKY